MKTKIAIIGAGNGGQAMAAYFGMNSQYEVRVFDHFQETVDVLDRARYIDLEGAVEGRGTIAFATTDIEKAICDVKLIMVVNPAIYHKDLATLMAPYIQEEQLIFLNPSSVFGAFAFKKALEDAGCTKNITIGESHSLLFAARLVENGRVNIGGKKSELMVAAFPACNANMLYDIIRPVISEIEECESVIETSFANTNAMVHPLPTIMNASWTESGAKFKYYWDGIGETVGDFIEKLYEERIAIGEKLGLKAGKTVLNFFDEYVHDYNTTGDSVSKVLKSVEAYRNIYSGPDIHCRYIYEDIPTGMVPLISIGELLGMPVDRMKLVTKLCETMLNEDLTNCDYSRNLEHLGLEGMDAEDIIAYAKTGVKP